SRYPHQLPLERQGIRLRLAPDLVQDQGRQRQPERRPHRRHPGIPAEDPHGPGCRHHRVRSGPPRGIRRGLPPHRRRGQVPRVGGGGPFGEPQHGRHPRQAHLAQGRRLRHPLPRPRRAPIRSLITARYRLDPTRRISGKRRGDTRRCVPPLYLRLAAAVASYRCRARRTPAPANIIAAISAVAAARDNPDTGSVPVLGSFVTLVSGVAAASSPTSGSTGSGVTTGVSVGSGISPGSGVASGVSVGTGSTPPAIRRLAASQAISLPVQWNTVTQAWFVISVPGSPTIVPVTWIVISMNSPFRANPGTIIVPFTISAQPPGSREVYSPEHQIDTSVSASGNTSSITNSNPGPLAVSQNVTRSPAWGSGSDTSTCMVSGRSSG